MSKKGNGRRPANGVQYWNRIRVTVSFDPETWDEIKKGAGESMSERIRELIEWGLEAEREDKGT